VRPIGGWNFRRAGPQCSRLSRRKGESLAVFGLVVFNQATGDAGFITVRTGYGEALARARKAARRRIAVGRRPTFLVHDYWRRVHGRDYPGSRVDPGRAVRFASAYEARTGKAVATDTDRQLEVRRRATSRGLASGLADGLAGDLQLVVRGRIRQARAGPRWPLVFDAPGELIELRLAHWPRCRGLSGLSGFRDCLVFPKGPFTDSASKGCGALATMVRSTARTYRSTPSGLSRRPEPVPACWCVRDRLVPQAVCRQWFAGSGLQQSWRSSSLGAAAVLAQQQLPCGL
jgi:hypothetical protein